ncbi:MAG: hypothetical protein ABI824_11560 [Acidobacteriota bacterium]
MAVIPTGYVSQQQIADEIDRAKQKLGPEVVRLKYTVGLDTSDEPAIHFRIVLTDAAAKWETLGEVASRVEQTLFEELRPNENWGLRSYFNFRSQSEQAETHDLAWA